MADPTPAAAPPNAPPVPPAAPPNGDIIQGVTEWLSPGAEGPTPDGREWVVYPHLILAGGNSISWRYNNPGSLHYTPFAKQHGAYIIPGWSPQSLAIFPTPTEGWDAMTDLLTSNAYTGLTMTQVAQRWVGPNWSNWLSTVLSICAQLGKAVTAATVLDPSWTPADIQILGRAISRAEGYNVPGQTYADSQAGLPDWIAAIFARRFSNAFFVTLTPALGTTGTVPCCSGGDPAKDPPSITFSVAITTSWNKMSGPPLAVDFPADTSLRFWLQDATGTVKLVRTGTGTYTAALWAKICESGWYNVHASLTKGRESYGLDKSSFHVDCPND